MANQFSVTPLGGLDVGTKLENIIQGGRQQYKRQQWEKTAPGIIKGGDPDAIADLMVKYPEMSQKIAAMSGYRDEAMLKPSIELSKSILTGTADPKEALGQYIQAAQERGEDVSKYMNILGKEIANPGAANEWAGKWFAMNSPAESIAYRKTLGADGSTAEIATFDYLTAGLPEAEKEKAKRIKLGLTPRASENAVAKAIKANAIEVAKLQARLKLEPQVAGAVVAAKNQAAATVKEAGTVKSNKTAWNVYNNSMGNLAKAMQGTATGPAVGFIPAVTTNQQIAEGAVAVLAPVLKQMFRAAGEGVFTDKDQELLMKMVPTRKDTPEARAAKIQGIDAVVRAKLGMVGETTTSPEDMPQQIDELSDEDLEAQIKALQQGAQ